MDNVLTKFKIGEIVTFRNHPLLYDPLIKGDSKYVPPLMIVKEIIFESEKKKIQENVTGKIIAERIKYICVYFDDDKSKFIGCHLYESMLENIDSLHVGTIDIEKIEAPTELVQEVQSYAPFDYEYGKLIYFKTKKLEIFKRRSSKTVSTSREKAERATSEKITEREIRQYVVNYASPDFIISGYKKELYKDLHFKGGKIKRLVSEDLIKIQWYNPVDQKFSEDYLPVECFTDVPPFETKLSQIKQHLVRPQAAAHIENLPLENTSKTNPQIDKSTN